MTVAHATSRPGVVSLAGGLTLGKCRVPYRALELITPAEAVARGTIVGCLVAGALDAAVDATDCVIEARRSCETMVTRGSTLTRCVVTGIERETDGTPLALHRVRQHLNGSGYTLTDTTLEWMNDGWSNAHHSEMRGGAIGPHVNYIYSGDRQHPDCAQSYGHGGLVIEDCDFLNDAAALPLGRDGRTIPVTGTSVDAAGREWPGPSSGTSLMMNDNRPTVDANVLTNLRSHGTASVHYNLGGGAKFADGLMRVQGLVAIGGGPVVRAPRAWLSAVAFPSPDADWRWGDGSSQYGDLGPSECFTVQLDDGTTRNVTRREVI